MLAIVIDYERSQIIINSGQLREVAAQKSLSALQIWLDIITMLDKILIPEGEGIVRKGGHLVDLKNDEITTL